MPIKPYRLWSPDQPYFLPPSPSEWLPKTHFVYFLLDVLDTLDVGPIEMQLQAKDLRGNLPYPPQYMVGLLLYAYCRGVFSSRKIERAIEERVDFRVLSGGLRPDHVTISRFRRNYLSQLSALFLDILRLCEQAGLASIGRVALDGSKVKANASKHKAMSYEYMRRRETELEKEIAALLLQAAATDGAEDEEYGEGQRPQDIPEELARRQARLSKIREAKAALEEGARQARAAKLEALARGNDARGEDDKLSAKARKAARTRAQKQRREAERLRGVSGSTPRGEEEASKTDDVDEGGGSSQDAGSEMESGEVVSAAHEESTEQAAPTAPNAAGAVDEKDGKAEMPTRSVKSTMEGQPDKKAQRNFTDPDSSIMSSKGGFEQAYNGQVVSNEEQVILAHGLSNSGSDTNYFQPMFNRVLANIGLPAIGLADAGYWSPDNAAYSASIGMDAHIATSRESKLKKAAEESGLDPPQAARPLDQMRSKLRSPEGREAYRARKWIVEPVFGQIKEAMGFQTFTMRGLEAARGEWGFVCACHNLRKFYRQWLANGEVVPA